MDEVYFVRVVGVSNYQQALAESYAGQAVRFVHEPDNPYDAMALRVENSAGATIGYIPRNSWLRAVIHERGRGVTGSISSVGMARSCMLGVTISVAICDDEVIVASYFPDQLPPEPPKGGFRYWVTSAEASDQRAA
ncbi:HIRAN domain-containing protein [Sphingobium agri]|uniref:HIRAN domain-containing protein n=1 Tax=Sphingobium agri TaxID=2933566 RepID=A0ABT0E222_9SPHN|nr:HIRAN domain-containing protein [Sphingobium agri]MCK0533424.1 HIRAN domain-containing protein [Sphingobium agri]